MRSGLTGSNTSYIMIESQLRRMRVGYWTVLENPMEEYPNHSVVRTPKLNVVDRDKRLSAILILLPGIRGGWTQCPRLRDLSRQISPGDDPFDIVCSCCINGDLKEGWIPSRVFLAIRNIKRRTIEGKLQRTKTPGSACPCSTHRVGKEILIS